MPLILFQLKFLSAAAETTSPSCPCSTFNRNAPGAPGLFTDPWIGAVIRTDDSCTQLFSHLSGQQTVCGPFSRSPRTAVNEHHQRCRHISRPAQAWRVVQVQFVSSSAKGDALKRVREDNNF